MPPPLQLEYLLYINTCLALPPQKQLRVKLYDLQDYLAMHTTIQCNVLIPIDSLNFTMTLTCLFNLILTTLFGVGFCPSSA